MLDIKWIRENPKEFEAFISARGVNIDINSLLNLDEEKRHLTTLIQQFQQARNVKSKRLGAKGNQTIAEFEQIKRDVKHINDKLEELNKQLLNKDELNTILSNIPNIPADDVPVGKDETNNKIIRNHLDPKYIQNPKEHFELGKKLKMMDFEQTAKICGSRFVTLKKDLAKLERALISFMIDTHTNENGFEEISAPALVRPVAMYNTGQLPKFAEEFYMTKDETHCLIPTGEVPLTNMVYDQILEKSDLPIRMCGYTPCFRSEAGSAGKDTKGMIRNHQFGKVELVTISTPEDSKQEHEKMLKSAEVILQKLELPYQVVLLCTGDMGFSANKTYDLEVWMPGQNKYREISSVSNCGDFQARRMKARYKDSATKENIFVHTLNGSGLSIGRTIVAILENYQQNDGSILVPNALISYMGGQKIIAS